MSPCVVGTFDSIPCSHACYFSASTRMQSGNGLSFSEFTYPLLQGYDWWHMYSHFQLNGIQVQIGGSDQYGNIMAGIDVVNCIRRNHHEPKFQQETDEFLDRPMGFTVPLLTTAAGEKFGKTAGNAIWLDKDMTSAFDLYQVLNFLIEPLPAHTKHRLTLSPVLPPLLRR